MQLCLHSTFTVYLGEKCHASLSLPLTFSLSPLLSSVYTFMPTWLGAEKRCGTSSCGFAVVSRLKFSSEIMVGKSLLTILSGLWDSCRGVSTSWTMHKLGMEDCLQEVIRKPGFEAKKHRRGYNFDTSIPSARVRPHSEPIRRSAKTAQMPADGNPRRTRLKTRKKQVWQEDDSDLAGEFHNPPFTDVLRGNNKSPRYLSRCSRIELRLG